MVGARLACLQKAFSHINRVGLKGKLGGDLDGKGLLGGKGLWMNVGKPTLLPQGWAQGNLGLHALGSEQKEEDEKNFKWKASNFFFGASGSLAAGGIVRTDDNSNESGSIDEVDLDGEDEDKTDEESERSVSGEPPLKKPDKSAPVWKFASKIGKNKAWCNVCKNCYSIPNGSTSNIQDHILEKHSNTTEGKQLAELVDKKKKQRKTDDAKKEEEKKGIKRFFKSDRMSKVEKGKIDDAVVEFVIARSEPFLTVEDYYFRKMFFRLNTGYVMLSNMELRRKVDEKIVTIKEDLSKEIQEDIKSHKSISITSDGGNSGDQNKTKKNTLTVSRINDNFEMKTDTVAIPEARGSQTGPVLRAQWKEELQKIGYDGTWSILATTDAASNERSARQVGRHEEIGLKIKYATDCADHQVKLMQLSQNTIFYSNLSPSGSAAPQG